MPHWAKDDKLQYSTFNARAEEFTTKPAFRDAWTRDQRCLVVTNGFYEWKKLDAKGMLKQPYAIAMADGDAQMVMAGLWAKWKSPTSGEEVLSCTILTCEPNRAMGELHNRMPVILAESDWPKWLRRVLINAFDVRLAPKATELLHRRTTTRCANREQISRRIETTLSALGNRFSS
jgi:putative SOS response-associated peptidase YedK